MASLLAVLAQDHCSLKPPSKRGVDICGRAHMAHQNCSRGPSNAVQPFHLELSDEMVGLVLSELLWMQLVVLLMLVEFGQVRTVEGTTNVLWWMEEEWRSGVRRHGPVTLPIGGLWVHGVHHRCGWGREVHL